MIETGGIAVNLFILCPSVALLLIALALWFKQNKKKKEQVIVEEYREPQKMKGEPVVSKTDGVTNTLLFVDDDDYIDYDDCYNCDDDLEDTLLDASFLESIEDSLEEVLEDVFEEPGEIEEDVYDKLHTQSVLRHSDVPLSTPDHVVETYDFGSSYSPSSSYSSDSYDSGSSDSGSSDSGSDFGGGSDW